MFCKYCGGKLDNDAVFCSHCGGNLENSARSPRSSASDSPALPSGGAARSVQIGYADMNDLLAKIRVSFEHWISYIVVVFALWGIGLFPLFSDWIKFDLFGYYSEEISVFAINKFLRESIQYLDGDVLAAANGINAFIIIFSLLFIILLGFTVESFYRKNENVFKYSIALSSALILFTIITLIVVNAALNEDVLASSMISFTAAPYILIVLCIAAIALTVIAKNHYAQESLYTAKSSVGTLKIAAEKPLVYVDEKGNALEVKINGIEAAIHKLVTSQGVSQVIIAREIDNKVVAEISDEAFNGCKTLQSVKMPPSVAKIGRAAFCDCIALTDIELPEKLDLIDGWAFCNCVSLSRVTIPKATTSIADTAFSGCNITITAPQDASYYGYEPTKGVIWIVETSDLV